MSFEIDYSFVAFIAFATIALLGSLMVVFKKNAVSAAFSLILVLFSFAGIYAVLGAHFVAALQILIYTGAIMVLFVFVIMLLNDHHTENDLEKTGFLLKVVTSLSLVALGTILVKAVYSSADVHPTGTLNSDEIIRLGGSVQVISEALFKDNVFQFELLSFLILAAVIATITLAKRGTKSSKNGSET